MGFRAAVTTSDGENVDLHFGQAARFLIIDVEEDGTCKPVEWRDAPERHRDADGCHGWFDKVTELLPDVDYVLTERIGPKPHRSLSAAGITPLEVPSDLHEALVGLAKYRNRMRPREAGAD